jgi:hypothetical protein
MAGRFKIWRIKQDKLSKDLGIELTLCDTTIYSEVFVASFGQRSFSVQVIISMIHPYPTHSSAAQHSHVLAEQARPSAPESASESA